MPSILGDNLIDQLVPTVDAVRTIHGALGDRQWAVTLVRRRWSGGRLGAGTPSFVSETTIPGPPALNVMVRDVLRPCGLEEEGDLVVTEVSLTFTEAELTGRPIAPGDEFYVRVTDAHGQGVQTRFYMQSKPPVADRRKSIGWMLYLHRVQLDGAA